MRFARRILSGFDDLIENIGQTVAKPNDVLNHEVEDYAFPRFTALQLGESYAQGGTALLSYKVSHDGMWAVPEVLVGSCNCRNE